ncbi:MAG TPA: DUF2330 domain-containing protein [Candidatus Limnocylindrales bacterium]|nr:DUF2330 domain-containing protein [Candidatus Limnocylindrales bacterium]
MRMRKLLTGVATVVAVLIATSQPAAACAGLIGPNGAVNLLRTTTFAGYHDGVEHYVTSFQFGGGSGQFGSLVPLPGIPTDIVRGGDWTLQRLIRETEVLAKRATLSLAGSAETADRAEVLKQVKIDALDVTILRGGGAAVGTWATEHGFRLPPDAPEVLDFYAARSPIFMAAVFDADAAKARGQNIGDGTPVHLVIPTPAPWVPLRILGLGKSASDRVDADVYLLTDAKPRMLPTPIGVNGMRIDHSAAATSSLLTDLRSDKGMDWVPSSGWLTKVVIDGSASQLRYDLAISSTAAAPSAVAAGLSTPTAPERSQSNELAAFAIFAVAFLALGATLLLRPVKSGVDAR